MVLPASLLALIVVVGDEIGKALKEVECRLSTKGKQGATSKSDCAS